MLTSSTLFVTATLSDNTARLIRLNTVTGARQWTVNLAEPSGEIPILAGYSPCG